MELTFDSTHWLNPRLARKAHRQRRGHWLKDLVAIRPDPDSNASVSFGVSPDSNVSVSFGDESRQRRVGVVRG
jgi:hypothetical protein